MENKTADGAEDLFQPQRCWGRKGFLEGSRAAPPIFKKPQYLFQLPKLIPCHFFFSLGAFELYFFPWRILTYTAIKWQAEF